MAFFLKKIEVFPNQKGYLFRAHRFNKTLEPGYYQLFDPFNHFVCLNISNTIRLLTITNQEVLTRDNISLRFSYAVIYKINDGQLFLSGFDLSKALFEIMRAGDEYIHNASQIILRDTIAGLTSEELNEKRSGLFNNCLKQLNDDLKKIGVLVEKIDLKDILFPKAIQDLFAKQLEAKIRAKTDLENARAQTATARAFKNAADLIKNDENIKYLLWLETITKFGAKGNNKLVIKEEKKTAGNK